jgi:DNA-binding Lrp family transcriptional regulator
MEGPRKLAVDATDVAIIREIVQAASGTFRSEKVSMEALARKLGMHPNTVSDRVKRLREAGWYLPLTIVPTPSIVGLSLGRFFVPMTMASRTPELLDKIMAMPCVFYIADMMEGWEPGIFAANDADLETLARKIVGLLGGTSVNWMIHTSRDWPTLPRHDLDATDLAIFDALLTDYQASLDNLAARIGMNPRTLRRRHEHLREIGAYRVYPYGTDVLPTGLTFLHLQVGLPEAGAKRQAAEAEIGRLLPNLFARQGLLGGAWFVLYGDEPGELQAQAEAVGALPGVTMVSMRQLRRYIPNPNYPPQIMDLLRAKAIQATGAVSSWNGSPALRRS